VEEFDLQEKLLAVTADNAANNVSMVDEFAIRVQQHWKTLGIQGESCLFGDLALFVAMPMWRINGENLSYPVADRESVLGEHTPKNSRHGPLGALV